MCDPWMTCSAPSPSSQSHGDADASPAVESFVRYTKEPTSLLTSLPVTSNGSSTQNLNDGDDKFEKDVKKFPFVIKGTSIKLYENPNYIKAR